ncbi:MAG: hypothetical protein DWQ42_16325 [Planctomycetota bacterium]|nr:MAG: hypothetical protein DWQ42_16325 [Planctomycetota bacterium]REK37425.1 MAG: hypothetical protein DWQ46_22350 [Planctomycetota bacterium]
MRYSFLVLTAGTLFLFVGTTAEAQYQDPRAPGNQFVRTPSVSPYLNLLRSGAGPGLNFQTLVRPQVELQNETQRQYQQFQQQQRQQRQFDLQQQGELQHLQRQQQIQQQQQQFFPSPFTLPLADPLTGAAQSIRPTGQGRPINYPGTITGHQVGRMQFERSTGGYFFGPIQPGARQR